MIFCFGEFALDIDRGMLLRNDIDVPLRPKSFEVLHCLVAHQGVLITKDQLFDTVWPGVVVTPDSINQCIIEIRKLLGDSDRNMIRTVPKRGFVFDIPVTIRQTTGEVEPESDSRTDGTSFWTRFRFRPLIVAALLLLITAVGYLFMQHLGQSPTHETKTTDQAGAEQKSIVVLPFTDMSATGDQAYLADGIAEELLNLLSHVSDLRVISRTSAFAFKGQNITMAEIADRLNVSHVLEGSVRVNGDQLRVTTQLIEARTDKHLWSRVFERSYDNIFDVQDEVATLVTRQLEVDLLGAQPHVQRTDPEAYSLYLKAKIQNLTEENLDFSISKLKQALVIDPKYAPAWVRLGEYYFSLVTNFKFDEITFGLAVSAAEKALRLDPYYAPVHTLLGTLSMFGNDLQSSARHYERAFEIEPNDEDLMTSAISLLQSLGRFDESEQLLQAAMDRDPLSKSIPANLGLNLLMDKRAEEAEQYWRQAVKLNPDGQSWLPLFLAFSLAANGKHQEAMEVTQNAKDHIYKTWVLVWLYQQMGMTQDYETGLTEMRQLEGDAPNPNWARFYALLGDADAAFDRLKLDEDVTHWNRERYWPMYWPIEHDPRWEPFLEQMGVSDAQLSQIEFNLKMPN